MPVWVTYDSGANGHYLNKIDHSHAGLPILKLSTKQMGVANGGVSLGTHLTRLPFPQLSHKASTEDTFTDFLNSFMSVGKTADDVTVLVFNKSDVKVYYKE